MKKVKSSHLDSIHYDPVTKVLEITFKKDEVYHYNNVEPLAYSNFENAKSHGKHFDKHIKNKYSSSKK